MGKQERRVTRKGATALRSVAGGARGMAGYDLSRARATDIVAIELDCNDNTMTVQMALPVGTHDSFAEYEESFDFDEEKVPGYLRHAARDLARAALRVVRERVYTSGELPCATCTGHCCGVEFTAVRVTSEDVERLNRGGVDIGEHVMMYDDGEDFTGHVGELVLVDTSEEGGQQACPFLMPPGCAVYEHRPRVCREYSPWDCELHHPDPDKIDGTVKLGVSKQEDTDGTKEGAEEEK